MSLTLEESPNARINKTLLDRYTSLELPDGKVIATYIWIDGTGVSELLKAESEKNSNEFFSRSI